MMEFERDLHVVSFNVPYPANYGGVIDVYYKLKALAEEGVRIHLHTYQYGRESSSVLEKLCHKVYYYKRKIYSDPLFTKLPYIIATRNSNELLLNLLQDNHPILFEGLHCCYHLAHPALADREKIVRMHNIEHSYYRSLSHIERNLFKKYFFSIESERLKQFEKVLVNATGIAAISPDDHRLLSSRYANVFYLPVFHANKSVTAKAGHGEFALYHGNLSVGENNQAALFLIREVFCHLDYPLIIAGMNPGRELRKAADEHSNITLLDKVDTQGINRLIEEAHINVLPTFQQTGMKLKLINVLFQGRHCLVNTKMVAKTGLEPFCHVVNDATEMRKAIIHLAGVPFSQQGINKRAECLEEDFSNRQSIQVLLEKVYAESSLSV